MGPKAQALVLRHDELETEGASSTCYQITLRKVLRHTVEPSERFSVFLISVKSEAKTS